MSAPVAIRSDAEPISLHPHQRRERSARRTALPASAALRGLEKHERCRQPTVPRHLSGAWRTALRQMCLSPAASPQRRTLQG